MDIGKLIEEQTRTQEILKKLEQAGTLDKFLEGLEGELPVDSWNMWNQGVSSWDYDRLDSLCHFYMASELRNATESLQKVKYFMQYLDNAYRHYIELWEGYRTECEKHRGKKWDWTSLYKNPECLDFFEKYEKAHNITSSIYQEAKAIRKENNGTKD